MKKLLLFAIIIFAANQSFSQTEIKAGMGINFLSMPSVQDYINQNFAPSNEQIGSFGAAVIFAAEAGYFFNNEFEITIELPYQIYSYSKAISFGQYELAYNSFLPSVLAYYVLFGKGYNFKFGGGAGPRFISVTEKQMWNGTERDFNSTGFGLLLRLEGNTLLGENLYANIGLDMRYDVNGEPEDVNGNKLFNNVQKENVNFNTLTFGLKLGVSYLFGVTE